MSTAGITYYGDPEVAFWTFFVFCMVVVSVTLFVMFYGHRLAAQIIFRIVSLHTWRKYGALLECESLIITPLSGKIFFRNLKWTTKNDTINIFRGYLVVRHWLSTCRTNEEDGAGPENTPCRFGLYFEGFEWFIYNRTAVYSLIEQLFENERLASENEGSDGGTQVGPDTSVLVEEVSRAEHLTKEEKLAKDSFFRRFLPLDIAVRKGAVLIGNPDMPTILTGQFESGFGVYRAVECPSSDDYYRVRHELSLISAKISMRPNVDYRTRSPAEAKDVVEPESKKPSFKDQLVRFFIGVNPSQNQDSIPMKSKDDQNWSGLSRYQEAEEPLPHQQNLREEYARVADVLVAKKLVVDHLMDVAGPKLPDNLNPSPNPPAWNVTLTLHDGVIRYGAWSDRQRVALQKYFYPPMFRNQRKTDLSGVSDRVHEEFVVKIVFEGETTWRVPTQEQSKDWRFPKDNLPELQMSNGPKTTGRPYGWLDIKCSEGSNVEWALPLMNDEHGYVSKVAVSFANVEITTSVNYSTLLSAPNVKVDFAMPGPLQWNAFRRWNISLSFNDADLWLLRDHITLLTDLVRDWTAGPPSDPALFIPIEYALNINFDVYRLRLCANEGNVIEQPNSISDNIYFVLRGPKLNFGLALPFMDLDPPKHDYKMSFKMQDISIDVSFPPSHTIGAYISTAHSNLGFVRSWELDIVWTISREYAPGNSDVVAMDMRLNQARLTVFGFLLRYVVWLKENYIAPHTSYVMVDEYRVMAANPAAAQKLKSLQEAAIPPSNPTDLRVSLDIDDAMVLLPHNIYGGEDVSVLKTRSLVLDNRNYEHYMDLTLSCSPITVYEGKAATAQLHAANPPSTNYLVVDDLVVRGHRIFGPMPNTTVYAVDWRIHIADVAGVAFPPFLSRLGAALKSFKKTFLDYDNLNVPYPELLDVTSIEVAIDHVNVAVWGTGSVSSIELERGVTIRTDDWATEKATRRLQLELPSLAVSLKSYSESTTPTMESWGSDRIDYAPWVEVAKIQTGVHVQAWLRGAHWEAFSKRQERFLATQDAVTHRTAFYYDDLGGELSAPSSDSLPPGYFLPPFRQLIGNTSSHAPMVRRRSTSKFSVEKGKFTTAPMVATWLEDVDEVQSIISHTADDDSATSIQDGASVEVIEVEEDARSSGEEHDQPVSAWPVSYPTSPMNEPPPSRSIPYKSYLRRFQLALARGASNPNTGIRFIPVGNERDAKPEKSEASFGQTLSERDLLVGFGRDGKREVPGEERDTVIIQFASSSEVMVTPVSLKIVEEFVAALDQEVSPPEYIIDSLEGNLPGPASNRPPPTAAALELLLSIPKINLHSLQNVTFPEEQTFLTEEGSRIRTRYDLADAMVSPADVIIEGILLRTYRRAVLAPPDQDPRPTPPQQEMPGLRDLKVDFSLATLKLNLRFADSLKETGLFGIPSSKHHFNTPGETYSTVLDEFPIVLDAYIEQPFVSASLERGKEKASVLDAGIGGISVTAINQTVEILFGAAFSWVTFVNDLDNIVASYQARQLRQNQIFLAALASCGGPARWAPDPAFIQHPSALWTLGYRPFQSSSAWRLLHRLRYRLKLLPPADIDRRRAELSDLGARELWTTLMANLADNHTTEAVLGANGLLSAVFPHESAVALPPVPPVAPSPEISLLSATQVDAKLSFGRVGLLIYEYQSEDNALVFGPATVGLRLTNNVSGEEVQSRQSTSDGHREMIVECHGALDKIGISLNPNMLAFSKHVLRVYRWFLFKGKGLEAEDLAASSGTIVEHPISPTSSLVPPAHRVKLHGAFRVGTISVKASAHNVFAQLKITAICASIAHVVELARGLDVPGDVSEAAPAPFHSTLGRFSKLRGLVMEKGYKTDSSGDVQLIAVDVGDGFIEATLAKGSATSDARETACLLLGSKMAVFKVPQSLLKLYTFMEKWRDDNLPRYDSLINEMIKQLDAPVAETQNSIVDRYVPPWERRDFRIQLSLKSIGLQLDLLSNLRIAYDVLDVLGFVDTTMTTGISRKPRIDIASRIAKQELRFQTRAKGGGFNDTATLTRFNPQAATIQNTGFSLPSIGGFCAITFPDRAANQRGPSMDTSNPPAVDAYVVIDSLNAPISVSMIDHFLTAQSVVGNEVNDLLDTLVLSRRRAGQGKPTVTEPTKDEPKAVREPARFALKIVFEEPRVEASSPSAAVVVGAETLEGFVTNRGDELHAIQIVAHRPARPHLFWKFAANGLAFDVMQHLPDASPTSDEVQPSAKNVDRSAKLATVASDISLSNIQNRLDGKTASPAESREASQAALDEFYAGLHRLHIVMQPTALGKILDFGVFYSMELERRKMQRTADLEKLKESTTLFLRSIDVDLPKTTATSTSIFRNKRIFLEVNRIAAVIPLDEPSDRNATTSAGKLTKKQGVKAFMGSIHLLTLATSNLDVNRGSLQEICFQFIHDFDQDNEKHFNPNTHMSVLNRNRLRVPEISGDVIVLKEQIEQKFRANGAVSGFECELDSSISRYVNAMISVWRSSRDRMLQVLPSSAAAPAPKPQGLAPADSNPALAPRPGDHTATPVVLDIQATFQFRNGGSIRIFSKGRRATGANASGASKAQASKPTSSNSKPTQTASWSAAGSASQAGRRGNDAEVRGSDQLVHQVTIPGLELSLRSKTLLGGAGTITDSALAADRDLRRMHVELLIAKSENTFFPSIITFFNEIASNVVVGSGGSLSGGAGGSNSSLGGVRHQRNASIGDLTGRTVPRMTSGGDVAKGIDAITRLREDHHTISVYFRLDNTRVDLSCQPVQSVTSAFEIERSHVLFFFTRDARLNLSASATARVGNISCRVRHAYGSEDSAQGSVGSVSLNAAMMPKSGVFEYAFQLLVPNVSASMNFRFLQDIFFLQTCWIPAKATEGTPIGRPACPTQQEAASNAPTAPTGPLHARRQSRVLGSLSSLASGAGGSFRNLEPLSSASTSTKSLDFGSDQGSSESLSTVPTVSIRLVAKVGAIQLGAELGHAIGKTTLDWKDTVIDWRRLDRPGQLPKLGGLLSISEISMMSEGRLAGRAAMQGLRLEVDSAEPSGGAGSRGGATDISKLVEDLFCIFGVQAIQGNYEYQFERVLLLDGGLLRASIVREWFDAQRSLDCSLKVVAIVDSLKAIASRRTLPTVMHVAGTVAKIIEEKQVYVRSKFAAPSQSVSGPKQDLSFGFTGARKSESIKRVATKVYNLVFPVAGRVGQLRGQVAIIVKTASITLFRYNFRDTDSALANLSGLELRLDTLRSQDNRDNPKQTSSTTVAALQVLKTTGSAITASQERQWTSKEWFEHVEKFKGIPVLLLPKFVMVLESVTRTATRVVEYSFNADFAGAVDVALNFALYKYLIELANLYLKALKTANLAAESGRSGSSLSLTVPAASAVGGRSLEALARDGGGGAGGGTGLLEVASNRSDRSSEAGDAPDSVMGPPQATVSAPVPSLLSSESLSTLENPTRFVIVGPVKFEPQLRVMGDATPAEWLEYLGVTKDKVPRVVYGIVTENFEVVFAAACAIAAILAQSADEGALPILSRRTSTF